MSQTLTDYFAGQIERGEWVPGVKLPSERALCERFELSRGAVRKVIDTYIDRGVLRRAVGSGTYVVAAQAAASMPTVAAANGVDVSPTELMEARLLIEPLMPSLIVRHATSHDFVQMEKCLLHGERAETNADFEFWDGILHKTLAQATHNTFIVTVLTLMTAVREAGEWGRLKQQALTPERRARYKAQHRAIVAALRERDEQEASRLIKHHLVEARTNLFEN